MAEVTPVFLLVDQRRAEPAALKAGERRPKDKSDRLTEKEACLVKI